MNPKRSTVRLAIALFYLLPVMLAPVLLAQEKPATPENDKASENPNESQRAQESRPLFAVRMSRSDYADFAESCTICLTSPRGRGRLDPRDTGVPGNHARCCRHSLPAHTAPSLAGVALAFPIHLRLVTLVEP